LRALPDALLLRPDGSGHNAYQDEPKRYVAEVPGVLVPLRASSFLRMLRRMAALDGSASGPFLHHAIPRTVDIGDKMTVLYNWLRWSREIERGHA